MSTRRSPRRPASRLRSSRRSETAAGPARLSDDETIVYDFTSELQDTHRVSDATFARAESRFGKAGVVDLAAISGYYTFLAMELNTARYVIPCGR